MEPLYDIPSILPGEEASLTGLLVNASVYRGKLIGTSKIHTKDGQPVPVEINLQIAEEHKLIDTGEWVFVICDKISENDAPEGTTTVLTCYQAAPKGGWRFGKFDSSEEIEKGQRWLNYPSKYPDAWVIDKKQKYTLELNKLGSDVTPYIFHEPSVPDIISKFEGGVCSACENARVICPGCPTGAHYLPRRFDAYIERQVFVSTVSGNFTPFTDRLQVVCPLCIGLDKMYEDKRWNKFYLGRQSVKEGNSRAERCNKWFEALGYDFRFEVKETEQDG
ncbi:hypothetical protein TWF718_005787 [Orbilia javanica]|uniref:Uncharacterized protein n=1 Tax=Orbilia javanica TaxID=47235 RepID=A0AAN8RP59_9PEZI